MKILLSTVYDCKIRKAHSCHKQKQVWTWGTVLSVVSVAHLQPIYSFLSLPSQQEYYDKGDYIIREGEEGSTFFILAKGKVNLNCILLLTNQKCVFSYKWKNAHVRIIRHSLHWTSKRASTKSPKVVVLMLSVQDKPQGKEFYLRQ